MNTRVLRFDSWSTQGPARAPWRMFEPTLPAAQGRQQSSSSVAGLSSDGAARAFERACLELSRALEERIRSFSIAVAQGDEVFALAVSPMVRQEAVRLAFRFAELGLESARDADEVVMPSAHQSSAGAVQFEWHRKGIDLEISVLPSGQIEAYLEREDREPGEFDLSAGMSDIMQELNAVLRR